MEEINGKDFYTDKEYCFNELHAARRIMCNKNLFTQDVARGLEQGLGMMYLYCPDDIKGLVLSQIQELTMREMYIPFSKLNN